jgi:hypothetical protein
MRLNCNDRPQLSRQTCDQAARSRSTRNCELNQLLLSQQFTICLHNSNINSSRSNILSVDLTRPPHTLRLLPISHGRPPFLRMTHVAVTGPRQFRTSESCLALRVEACNNDQAHLLPSHRLNQRRLELTSDSLLPTTIAEDNTAFVHPLQLLEEANGHPDHLRSRALVQYLLSTGLRAVLRLLLLDQPHGHRLGPQTFLAESRSR